jgi:N4-gp56 family major capsid protein
MAYGITQFGDISPRVANFAARELLTRGLPYLVLERFCQGKELPQRSTRVMTFRRYEALDSTPAALTEGVTPTAQQLTHTDYTVTLNQYGGLVTITDVIMDTHEDPVMMEATELLGEQAAQMMERVRIGVVKAGSNVFYSNGTGRADVNTAFDLTDQRRVTRSMKRQNARMLTRIIRSTPDYETINVRPSFVAIAHPDLEGDIRGLTGFTPSERYGSETPWENELGRVEDVRYMTTTLMEPYESAGDTPGATISTDGASSDVYPVIFLGRDAFACVPLRGKNRLTPMVVNPKPSDSDPLAQRGHVSWKAYENAVILNDYWMAVLETAATA